MVPQERDIGDIGDMNIWYYSWKIVSTFWKLCIHSMTLNAENMLKCYGGQKAVLHSTTIKQEKGYLGPHHQSFKPGDGQSVLFNQGDMGPYWMSEQE